MKLSALTTLKVSKGAKKQVRYGFGETTGIWGNIGVKLGWKSTGRCGQSVGEMGVENDPDKRRTESVQVCGVPSGTRRVFSTPLPRKKVIQRATKRRPEKPLRSFDFFHPWDQC